MMSSAIRFLIISKSFTLLCLLPLVFGEFLASISPSIGGNVGLNIGAPPGSAPKPAAVAFPVGYPVPGYLPQAYPLQGYQPVGYSAALPPGYNPYVISQLPLGARAVPNKHARRLAKKKTRSTIGAQDAPSAFPSIGCPTYFAYQFDKKRGGWYGHIGLPKLPNTVDYQVEVNMTINRNVLNSDVIKLNLMSNDQEAHTDAFLKWMIKFPYQDLLPKLTQIKYNDQIICVGEPEAVPRGGTQVRMWAKSHVTTGEVDDAQIYQVDLPEEPITEKPGKVGSVLGGLLESLDKLTQARFSGSLNGKYDAGLGPLYSTGQAGIGGNLYGSLLDGIDGNVKGVMDGQAGIGNFGIYGRGSGTLGGHISPSGIGFGGGFNGRLAPAGYSS